MSTNLLDPGKCDHPPDKQVYCGEQKWPDGIPSIFLWTCMKCGTTLCGPEPERRNYAQVPNKGASAIS
jgi:hypothetical protein